MIFLIYGDDKFRKSLKLDSIKNLLGIKKSNNFSFISLEDPELSEIEEQCFSGSLLSKSKTIHIKNSRFLKNKSEDKDIEKLLYLLENLPEDNNLIFDSEKLLGTLKIIKSIKKIPNIKIEEFKSFSLWENSKATEWLKEVLGLNFELAEFAVNYIGTEDSAYLYNEISKLMSLNQALTKELIKNQLKEKKDIFKFIKDLATNKKREAILELNKLIGFKDINLGSLALLDKNISNYIKLKLLKLDGSPREEISQILGCTTNRLHYLEKEVQAMDLRRLKNIKKLLLELEYKVKTGRIQLIEGLRLLVHSYDFPQNSIQEELLLV